MCLISVLLQTQHALWSAGIGDGIAYRPVSIPCALALNLHIGILRYEGKVR